MGRSLLPNLPLHLVAVMIPSALLSTLSSNHYPGVQSNFYSGVIQRIGPAAISASGMALIVGPLLAAVLIFGINPVDCRREIGMKAPAQG